MSLPQAAFDGELERVKQLLADGADIEVENDIGQTALHNAIENQHAETGEFLLLAGADVEHDTPGGPSPLVHAIDIETDSANQRGKEPPDTTLLRLLIKHGANVSRRCACGITPLEMAEKVHNRHAERILIARHAR